MALTTNAIQSSPYLPPLPGVTAPIVPPLTPQIPDLAAPFPPPDRALPLPPEPPRLADNLLRTLIQQQANDSPAQAQALQIQADNTNLPLSSEALAKEEPANPAASQFEPTNLAQQPTIPAPLDPATSLTLATVEPPGVRPTQPPADPNAPDPDALSPLQPQPPQLAEPQREPIPTEQPPLTPQALARAAQFSPIIAQYLAIDQLQNLYVAPNGARLPEAALPATALTQGPAPVPPVAQVQPAPGILHDLRV